MNAMRDLREQLTAYVTTIGDEPNFRECTACLRKQTVDFRLEVIRDAAPLSEALNQMQRRSKTPMFVQVDEDMWLFPNALERLRGELEKASPEVAILVAPLWDAQVERPIYGVKIYRTEIVKRFPHRDTISCDATHNQELEAAGFEVTLLPLRWSQQACLGLHGKHYTPATAFQRWRRIFEKRRRTGRPLWVAPWPARFLKRYQRTGSEVDLYSFLGAVSALSGEAPADREDDYRERSEDFERIRETLETDRHGRESLREAGEVTDSAIDGWKRRIAGWVRGRG